MSEHIIITAIQAATELTQLSLEDASPKRKNKHTASRFKKYYAAVIKAINENPVAIEAAHDHDHEHDDWDEDEKDEEEKDEKDGEAGDGDVATVNSGVSDEDKAA